MIHSGLERRRDEVCSKIQKKAKQRFSGLQKGNKSCEIIAHYNFITLLFYVNSVNITHMLLVDRSRLI